MPGPQDARGGQAGASPSLARKAFARSAAHEGYRFAEVQSRHGGVKQRWLMAHSEELEEADRRRLERRLFLRERELEGELKRLLLARRVFSSAGRTPKRPWKRSPPSICRFGPRRDTIGSRRARPRSRSSRRPATPSPAVPPRGRAGPREVRYRVDKVRVERDEAAIDEEPERLGRYILATSVLDPGELTGDELPAEYKGRHAVERGFRFLKDPLFFASSVFVKSPKRMAAITVVMGSCLLVYASRERSLREALAAQEAAGAEIEHHRGKPTRRLTLRWVFLLFQAVHLLKVAGAERISNLTEERRSISGLLVRGCRRYYLLA